MYLALLAATIALYRALSARRWTSALLVATQKQARDYHAMYATFTELIVVGVHCTVKQKTVKSTTFPKLHETLHFVHFILMMGPMKEFSTAYMESILRVVLKPSFQRGTGRIQSQAMEMLANTRRIELINVKVLRCNAVCPLCALVGYLFTAVNCTGLQVRTDKDRLTVTSQRPPRALFMTARVDQARSSATRDAVALLSPVQTEHFLRLFQDDPDTGSSGLPNGLSSWANRSLVDILARITVLEKLTISLSDGYSSGKGKLRGLTPSGESSVLFTKQTDWTRMVRENPNPACYPEGVDVRTHPCTLQRLLSYISPKRGPPFVLLGLDAEPTTSSPLSLGEPPRCRGGTCG